MFGADDESDGSDDDANDAQDGRIIRSLSMRDEVPPTESNEGSSIMRANGGRPQRKTKSKKYLESLIPYRRSSAQKTCLEQWVFSAKFLRYLVLKTYF